MSRVEEQVKRVSGKWSFRGIVIGLPVASACFLAEAVLATAQKHGGNVVGWVIDGVAALSALAVGVAFLAVLGRRADCEGRTMDRMAWVYLVAATVFGGWCGGCAGVLALGLQGQHDARPFGEFFLLLMVGVAGVVNLLAAVVLVLEVIKRCPVVPENGC